MTAVRFDYCRDVASLGRIELGTFDVMNCPRLSGGPYSLRGPSWRHNKRIFNRLLKRVQQERKHPTPNRPLAAPGPAPLVGVERIAAIMARSLGGEASDYTDMAKVALDNPGRFLGALGVTVH